MLSPSIYPWFSAYRAASLVGTYCLVLGLYRSGI